MASKTDELVTCSACGTKNVWYRTVCLSCGGDLPISKDGTEAARQPFVKWVRSLAKNLNTPTKWSISALFAVGSYFGATWFFFGSSHPCGILETRQRPYFVVRYSENAFRTYLMLSKNDERIQALYSEMIRRGNVGKEAAAIAADSSKRVDRALQDVSDAPKNAVHDLHEKIWNHYTPAGCFWEALAWNPNPYKGSPPLKDIPKGGE